MRLIESIEELNSLLRETKGKGKFKFNNFYPNPSLNSEWIRDRTLTYVMIDGTLFLIHDRSVCREIYFFDADSEGASRSILRVIDMLVRPVLIEVIAKDSSNVLDIEVTAKLMRMTRVGLPPDFCKHSDINLAVEEDLSEISEIFVTYFDPVLERIPQDRELRTLINSRSIALKRNPNGEIIGMIVYEKTGKSIHLRYWWTHPGYRNKGIGSELMSHFFTIGNDTVRQYLWVFEDNGNALKRYRHYGFEFDGIQDSMYLFY